jgi:hypothetical protein
VGTGGDEPGAGGPTIDWATQVEPLLATQCKGCHTAKPYTNNFNVTSPETIQAGGIQGWGFMPCKPEESPFLDKITSSPPGGSPMPLGTAGLEPEEVDLLTQWVAEGGQAEYDPSTCGVSWELHILPMLTEHGCNSAGCHSAETKTLGVNATTPEGLSGVLLPCDGAGSLIVDKVGPNPKAAPRMPLSSSFETLSEAEIQLLIDWIDQGAAATYDPTACP